MAPAGLRLAGFITGPVVLAVIEYGGRSYVVAPGENIEPGLRVTAIDAARQMVHLEWRGAPLDLRVSIPTP
ncbi:MAG TPA: hypothetical protein VKW09_14480 [bacterium]|nr:hypothetical protein [bacterium]